MTLERVTFVSIIIIVGILLWHGLEWRDSAKERLYVSMGSATVPLSENATILSNFYQFNSRLLMFTLVPTPRD